MDEENQGAVAPENAAPAEGAAVPTTGESPAPEGQQPPAEVVEEASSTDAAPEASEESEVAEEAESPDLYYNGEQVEVDIPEDVSEALKAHDLDVNAIVAELYSKDGDFTLSQETLDKLYGVYPKGIVDSYLKAIRTQNDQALKDYKQGAESEAKAAEQASAWAAEKMGGQETWDAVSQWLEQDTESVTDAEIAGFNRAMASGDAYTQELAINAMKAKYQQAVGDGRPNLVIPDGAGGQANGTALSRADYHKAMQTEMQGLTGKERQAKQAELDARRKAGMQMGL